jgi:hypothetical protein
VIYGRPIRRDDPKEPFLAFEVVARLLKDDSFLARLRRCRTPQEVFDTAIEVNQKGPEVVTT